MSRGRWGYYPCPYEVFVLLKELNKRWQRARRQAAAWTRWNSKLPHNRVRRPRVRNPKGWTVGYAPQAPLAEPPLDRGFCSRLQLPSGRVVVELSGHAIELAYRLARHPKATAEEVRPLPMSAEEIRDAYRRLCTH